MSILLFCFQIRWLLRNLTTVTHCSLIFLFHLPFAFSVFKIPWLVLSTRLLEGITTSHLLYVNFTGFLSIKELPTKLLSCASKLLPSNNLLIYVNYLPLIYKQELLGPQIKICSSFPISNLNTVVALSVMLLLLCGIRCLCPFALALHYHLFVLVLKPIFFHHRLLLLRVT